MATTGNVATLGSLHEEKNGKRKRKRGKSKQPLPVPLDGVISKTNLETEKENVVSQIQNNQIEGNTEIQALKESEMHDSVLEGALLFKSSPIQGGVIDENILSDKLKNGKKRKLKKRKQIIESDLNGSHHGEQMDANGRQDDSMAAVTQGTHTENVNRLDEQSSSTINKEPIKLDSLEDQNCAKNVGNLFDVATDQVVQIPGGHGLKKRKRGKKNKSANSNLAEPREEIRFPNHIAEGRDGDSVVSTKGIMSVAAESIHLETDNPSNEKLVVKNAECVEHVIPMSEVAVSDGTQMDANGRQNDSMAAVTQGTHTENVNRLDEQSSSTINKEPIKLDSLEDQNCAKNVGNLFDVATDQVVQIPGDHGRKKRRRGNKNKSANSNLAEPKEEIRFPNHIAEGRDGDSVVSTKGIMSVAAESIHLETDNPSNEKLVVKNDECVEHVIPTSEVAVSDGTQNIKISKSKRKRMQGILSSMSQPELKEENQNVLPTKGIVSVSAKSIHLETDNPSNEKLEVKNDECVEHVIPASEVAVSVGTQNIKIGKSKRKTMQRKLSSMSQSKLKEEHESTNFTMQPSLLNDQHVTALHEGIVNMPCVVTTKTTPNMSLHDTLAALPVQQGEMRASSICADHVDVGGTIAISEAVHAKTLDPSPERNHFGSPRRKLLILDINGLLADIVAPPIPSGYIPDIRVSRKAVFRRPFCDSFLQFCFERFDVGVWSSRVKQNLNMVIDFLMRGLTSKLLFCWNRSHCTTTKFPSIENKHKPMVMKELKRLWEKPSHAAWEKGKYDQSNTLLVDDSPYKALRNPADTGIFPLPYQYTDVNDCSLGPGGDLRVYLERLAMADNVPEFVRNNPYGQRPIRETNLSWKYYKKML